MNGPYRVRRRNNATSSRRQVYGRNLARVLRKSQVARKAPGQIQQRKPIIRNIKRTKRQLSAKSR